MAARRSRARGTTGHPSDPTRISRPRGNATRPARPPAAPGSHPAATPPLPRRRQEAERRRLQRRRLLAASAHVFARGFGRASVAAIVQRAGMSRRTFYEHFDDLADALVQLYDAAALNLIQSVEAAFHTEEDDVLARLRAALMAYATTIADNADLARIIYREIQAAGPARAVRHQANLARFTSLVTEWLADAHAAGLVSRRPDELIVFTLVAGIEGAAMRYVDRGEESRLKEAVPHFVELVVCAFR